ncbi:mitochondrial import inner membrane translocase subunit TIM14-like [Hibiscus syriacus]|uniref:Mitochondrial import inner membrane translocase subunit TIM14-like n=1 Tax=Hibiscus syriacus TaxID=106335 RepID=A0A6A3D3J5_HIBSY|nr:protein IQ-DOMAIN 1 [Hibiscus syriacus]KAE8735164.1 mitochondrial import inner membrane translocase subunit TIM14-like [Hibiscus syriacus]
MGKKGGWFSIVKKALSPDSKKDQKTQKSKKKWFGKTKDLCPVFVPEDTEDVKLKEAENEQSKHAYSVAVATAVAAEAAVAAAQAAAEVVRLTSQPRQPGKSNEEVAAIKIQSAFRGYLARRALRALRGLVRLKSLMRGQYVKHQASTTLKCMQTLARVQSEICARRIRISEENTALQHHLQQKCEKELEKLRASIGEDWNDSTLSKEQIKARQQKQQEAAMKRERALAYAYCHQQSWKNCSRSVNLTFMDPKNPHWGWTWLEQWMAARPWETRSTIDNNDFGSIKSIGEISRAYSLRDINNDNKPSPTPLKLSRLPSRQSHLTPPSKASSISSVSGKTRLPSPRGSLWGGYEDSRSILSARSDRYRRRSIAGSSMRDDESLTNSPGVPSYMTPTQSAKARSRVPSPLGAGTPNRGLAGSSKRRLSFPAFPASNRRHSDPPKIDITMSKSG